MLFIVSQMTMNVIIIVIDICTTVIIEIIVSYGCGGIRWLQRRIVIRWSRTF